MPKKLDPKGQSAPPPAPDFVASNDSVRTRANEIAAQQAKFSAAFKPKAGTLYVRNIRAIDCRVTLDTGRRIELKARGQVDDIAPVSREEQTDSKFIINIGLLYEVLDVKDAAEVIRKQAINAQTARPRNPLLDHLVNAKGEEYEITDVHIDPLEQERSIVVGQVTGAPDGRSTTDNTQIVRQGSGPQEVSVPGSRMNPTPEIPSDISAEDVREYVAWREAMLLRDSLGEPVIEETQTVKDD